MIIRAFTFTIILSAVRLLWPGADNIYAQENPCIAESRIWNENDEFVVLHYHDWRDTVNLADIYSDSQGWTRYFSVDNKLAYVELRSKKTTTTLWKVPSVALEDIWITSDSRYIVGMSAIWKYNPYHLVVFDREGNVMLYKRASARLAEFSKDDIADFWKKYSTPKSFYDWRGVKEEHMTDYEIEFRERPDIRPILDWYTYKIDGKFYIDLDCGRRRKVDDEAWRELLDRETAKPDILGFKFNDCYIDWYDVSSCNWQIIEEDGQSYFEFSDSWDDEERKRIMIPDKAAIIPPKLAP